MDKYEQAMITAVNRNHECKALASRLNAISARRRRRKKLWPFSRSAAAAK